MLVKRIGFRNENLNNSLVLDFVPSSTKMFGQTRISIQLRIGESLLKFSVPRIYLVEKASS